MKENGYSWIGVENFYPWGGIGMADDGGGDGLCIWGEMWESKCLFSCLHLDRISDFLFSRVFCDG